METKKQLIGLLGMSFMQMLCNDGVQVLHKDFEKRKRQRLAQQKKDFDAGVAILRPHLNMQPCFNPD
jgi:hypothetical protein